MDYKFINCEYLETVSGGDVETIRELVTIFSAQVVEIGSEMRSQLLKGDFHSLGMLAHKAKSSVAIMGMNDLAIMLKTLELQTKEGKEIEKYDSYITRFEQETKAAMKELENYLNNL
jgi:HPt (histidine-containing phosphotransfer) domain-containing protein